MAKPKTKKKIDVKTALRRALKRLRDKAPVKEGLEDVGLPGMYHPTEHDVMDELSRLDSFSHGEYN